MNNPPLIPENGHASGKREEGGKNIHHEGAKRTKKGNKLSSLRALRVFVVKY